MRLALSEEQPVRKAVLLRVPFVRRCALSFDDGVEVSAFIVNINTLGVYVANDEMPRLGQGVRLQFNLPESDRALSLDGSVAWLNPRQQHPVHSLPPGFGVKLDAPAGENRRCVEEVVEDYIARNPHVLK